MLNAQILYLRLFADRQCLSDPDHGDSHQLARDPKSRSPRMLVGDFDVAQREFKAGFAALRRGLRAPTLLVQPMELLEGGLTQVEQRVLEELGRGAGAGRVVVHTGAELSASEVRAQLARR